MKLIQKTGVLDIKNTGHANQIWLDITKKYNQAKGTTFVKKQLNNKQKNYKKALEKKKSNVTKSRKKTGT